MKKTNRNLKGNLLILTTVLLGMSFALIGCGFLDSNSQPEIDIIIDDPSIYVDDLTIVPVNITDPDVDNTHVINAYSDNPEVVTVSVDDTSVTIFGIAVGSTVVTVSVTDDSGQDNDTSTPLRFPVTVNDLIDRGACSVGTTLTPGESCSYGRDPFGEADIVFYVLKNGRACLKRGDKKLCVNSHIEQDDFFGTNFAAKKNPDGSWTIEAVPWLFNIRRISRILTILT